ncbi:MAG: hypothetical protein AAGD01_13855 [Acidobacteriota bacterium]
MKKTTALIALAAAFTLVLTLWPAAPQASAFVACEDCEEWMSPYARCAGLCNGIWISWCSDWLAWNCNSQLAPEGETKEEFLASLNNEDERGGEFEGNGDGDAGDGDDDPTSSQL